MSWLRWFKKIPSALKIWKWQNLLRKISSHLLYQLRILWMSSSSWLILCRKSPCLRKNNLLLIIQRPWDLIWKRSLDLNIWIVSLWSILVTSMSGHCNQELRVERSTFVTFMSIKALSVMENRSERFRPRVCFPFVKMFQATCERQQVDSRSFQTIPRKIT